VSAELSLSSGCEEAEDGVLEGEAPLE
jgi:hypothetical protein